MKTTRYIFNKIGDIVEYGKYGHHRGLNRYLTFDNLPIRLKEKLAVLMLYPDNSDFTADEGREGDTFWGYVDEDE